MSHTPEQLEIAKRMIDYLAEAHGVVVWVESTAFADALNYAMQHPGGSMDIEIAVRMDARNVDLQVNGAELENIYFEPTHAAIVRAWIPRVAPTPVVEGSVSR